MNENIIKANRTVYPGKLAGHRIMTYANGTKLALYAEYCETYPSKADPAVMVKPEPDFGNVDTEQLITWHTTHDAEQHIKDDAMAAGIPTELLEE